jgi:hypothetical protein
MLNKFSKRNNTSKNLQKNTNNKYPNSPIISGKRNIKPSNNETRKPISRKNLRMAKLQLIINSLNRKIVNLQKQRKIVQNTKNSVQGRRN